MQLESVAVTNAAGAVLTLPLEDISAGFVVREIDGLDPVAATLVSSAFANVDGEQFHSARRVPRNIKLSLGLDPDYALGSVKSLRDQLYAYFMPKSKIGLEFNMFDKFSDSIVDRLLSLGISGRIETFEAPLFTSTPQADISIMCFNPDFEDSSGETLAGTTVSDATTATVSYKGTVDTGVLLTLNVNRSLPAFTVYSTPPDGTLNTIDFGVPLLAGDVLTISSVVGNKYATLLRAGVTTSVLYGLSPQSGWLTLQPGDNGLRVYASGAAVPYALTYTDKYGGL